MTVVLAAAACSGAPGGEAPPDSTARELTGDTSFVDSDTLDEAADTFFESSGQVWREARARGVMFRAVGQEPGWLVEIGQNDTLRILVDYGAREIAMAVPEPAVDSTGLTTYLTRTEEHTVRIDVRAEPCADAMSGERFGATVLMVLDGVRYSGCGRSLTPP